MSTNYYFRSKEDVKFKVKLDNFLNSFKKDIDNFVYLNEEYSRIEDIEEKLRGFVSEYHWDIDNDLELCTTTANKLIFHSTCLYYDIDEIKEVYNSGKYYLINEYNDIFTWEEFLKEIEYDSNMSYKWI